MHARSSKRKARRDLPASSVEDPETASLRTENIPSISDKDFSENTERVEKSAGKILKETEIGQREIIKLIENLSSQMDSLSSRTPETAILEANEISSENVA